MFDSHKLMRIIRKKNSDGKKARQSFIRTVALFGGSFNPPHQGHVSMIRRLLRRRDLEQIWVLPVYRHPFQKNIAPYPDRFRMACLAFSALSKRVTVKRIEEKLGGISYTIRILKYLSKRYPKTHFVLVMGADSYRMRQQWKDFAGIHRLVDLLVFERGPKSVIPDVSSTKFRQGKQQNVPLQVRQYIERTGLYK